MVYVFLAEGFEEIEALTVTDVLRRADIEVETVSVENDGKKEVTGSHGIKVISDISFDEADFDKCEMIVLPGGMPGAENLAAHTGLTEKIKEFAALGRESGRYLAAICAAPMVFGKLGILEGRMATIYPGMEEELKGAFVMKNRVVVDDNIITSKGPGSAMEFAIELAAVLKDKLTAEKLILDMLIGR